MRRLMAMAAMLLGALPTGCVPEASQPLSNVVRQVDHLLVASGDAEGLFALLADTFQLPVAWPMADYGGFASGGVAVGNVNLEVIQDADPGAGRPRSRWTGFALEPEPLPACLPALRARGIAHGRPAPFRSRQANGSWSLLWTTVGLPEVSGDAANIFLCEYAHDASARRLAWREQLRSRDGGPLSVRGIRELVYGATDVDRMRQRWGKLLSPVQADPGGAWPVGAGPAIRVVPADRDGIRGVVIQVGSLERARRFLRERGLVGTDRPGEIVLGGSCFLGLGVTLTE